MIEVRAVAGQPLDSQRFVEYAALSHALKYGVNLHPIWIDCYVNAFSQNDRSLILEARDGATGALRGFLPLVRKDSRENRVVTLRRLVPAGYGPSDFFGIGAVPEAAQDVAAAIGRWFGDNRSSWDYLVLDLLPDSEGDWSRFAALLSAEGLDVELTRSETYLTLDSSGDYATYLKSLGAAKLKELRYYRRRLLARGVRVEVEHVNADLSAHFEDFIRVYASRRSSKTQSDPFLRLGPLKPFLEAIIRKYEPFGWVTLSLLKLDDVAVAWCYCLVYDGVQYYYLPTFREEYADCAPGKLLLFDLIGHAFETPSIREFNFMRLDTSYKRWFEPQEHRYCSVVATNGRSRRTRILKMTNSLTRLKRSLFAGERQ